MKHSLTSRQLLHLMRHRGPAANAQLHSLHGVLFHNGVIYVADSMNDRVLKISAE